MAGGIVFLSRGTFKTLAPVTGAASVHVEGAGRGATTVNFIGTGNGILIGEGADYAGVSNLTLATSGGAQTNGIHVQGASFVSLDHLNISGALSSGIRITDDGATNLGAYFVSGINIYIITSAEGVRVNSTTSTGGVTFPAFRNVAAVGCTTGWYLGSGASPIQTLSVLIEGGSASNGTTGITMTGNTRNTVIQGMDIEGNSGWGITNTSDVDGLALLGVNFADNTGGDYETDAKRLFVMTGGMNPRFYPANIHTNPGGAMSYVGPDPLRCENTGDFTEFRLVAFSSGTTEAAHIGLRAEQAGDTGILWSLIDELNSGERVFYQESASPRQLVFNKRISAQSGIYLNGHLSAFGTAPTAAAGANAGTTPPAPVVAADSTDARGGITFGTGTTAAAGAQAVVTFNVAYGTAPYVVVIPRNTATEALGLYISATATGSFTVSCTTGPADSQANTVYSFAYVVVG